MIQNLKNINENSLTTKTANVILIVCTLQVINVFFIYWNTKSNLKSPLIPDYITCEIFDPYVPGGMILSFGILIMFVLKIFKQPLIASIIGVGAIIWQQLSYF